MVAITLCVLPLRPRLLCLESYETSGVGPLGKAGAKPCTWLAFAFPLIQPLSAVDKNCIIHTCMCIGSICVGSVMSLILLHRFTISRCLKMCHYGNPRLWVCWRVSSLQVQGLDSQCCVCQPLMSLGKTRVGHKSNIAQKLSQVLLCWGVLCLESPAYIDTSEPYLYNCNDISCTCMQSTYKITSNFFGSLQGSCMTGHKSWDCSVVVGMATQDFICVKSSPHDCMRQAAVHQRSDIGLVEMRKLKLSILHCLQIDSACHCNYWFNLDPAFSTSPEIKVLSIWSPMQHNTAYLAHHAGCVTYQQQIRFPT